ncbi:hypothetical protein ART_1599 [Arthrobacter sp. PAMC 25486]|uniref:hypothetical protein n=1 Tax=Arthrobacter sp. PAMC 25486 TaxID=1494608 RepID=UPI000535CDEA|nr:hypothetical protein [Arthrobacter sp. PAMC 25486]AIY01198.1 hypothetical protein ART_1599 [Arthrobacter sp. PAMC 25486]
MTNQLFRDLLEGRIPMPAKPKDALIPFDHHAFNRAVTDVAKVSGWPYQYAADLLMRFVKDCPDVGHVHMSIGGDWDTKPNPPTDPRARALWAKEQRGNGPAVESLRVRGRNNRYKEKF